MTNYLNIEVPKNTKIAVIGDIHEHSQQFTDMVKKISPSYKMWLVSVGDIYSKGFGPSAVDLITRELQDLVQKNIGFVVQGNHEVKHIKHAIRDGKLTEQLAWYNKLPFGLSFIFSNGTRLTVIHAGVKPSHTWDDLKWNTDVVYIRTLDKFGEYIPLKWILENGKKTLKPKCSGCAWHEMYDGRFGYIISGHEAQKDGIPKFYKYSCNVDTSVYTTGILTAQVYSENGKDNLIQTKGKSAGWKLYPAPS